MNNKEKDSIPQKWFITVVENPYGDCYANLLINGVQYKNLPEHIDYIALKEAIKSKTGIEIPERKDMNFYDHGLYKYAYIDATQPRKDYRVTIDEIIQGWLPDFDNIESFQEPTGPVFFKPTCNAYCNFDDLQGIHKGEVIDYNPSRLTLDGYVCSPVITIRFIEEIMPDGKKKNINGIINSFYYSDSLCESTFDNAKEKALNIYAEIEQIKNLPKIESPKGQRASDYFDVIDFSALSDSQLIFAKKAAEKFIGTQSRVVDKANYEIISRFEKLYRKPSLSEQLIAAENSKENYSDNHKFKVENRER